ncbi:uncharacterized protein CIMG_03738 [Coccidioides immitis RS]|uniref:Uncharacterized protein n=3 Tax=Coccidioides immitis TaxID=5501 RepID=A0A0E1RWS7_COCIM|nr:uncharacterized protein CIMG_03738 [Coccidioides immitis RS]EAS32714.2 hypothetical protein CIMG_03738 [Coccidioides immitis RS]KMP07971.1 hypothetical protein CIRG_07652 [Coccidioides immitis RMSCC 2394]KMU85164.1 hypothetical protein CIHG_02946 [Coccidioides immitis H538.4]TPX19736.1 hypothetical protein DIZ76_017528 [Coccidioides immitis]
MRNPVGAIIHGYSSLKIRPTLRRIRACPHPWSTLFFLIWPFPWRYSLPYPLLSVEEIEKYPNIHEERQPGIRELYNIPIYRIRDTPLRSLYRLVEDLCASDFIMMGYECTYFFFHREPRWSLACIPDPRDKDPIRYAILASMVEALVDAFNWRLEHGIRRDNTTDKSEQRSSNFMREEAPSWTSKIGPVAKPLAFREAGSSDMTMERHFLKRNIRVPNGYLYTA